MQSYLRSSICFNVSDFGELTDPRLGKQNVLEYNVWQNLIYFANRVCAADLRGRLAEEHSFLYSPVPTKLNSLSPSGAIRVTHELPPSPTYVWPLSEAWQPCHSRGQDNPKDVSSPLMPPWERVWSLLQLCTLNHISGNILPRQADHAWNQK